MPFNNCTICHGSGPSTQVLAQFEDRNCGHEYCHRCKITHDSNVDLISTKMLAAGQIRAIDNEQQYRELFVETSQVRDANNEDYSDFSWASQEELRSGVANHAINCIRRFVDNPESNLKFLDIGCGSGFTSVELANEFRNAKIVSIDPSPQVKGVDGYDGRIEAIQGTLQSISLEPNQFDVIVILGNLMLHDDPFSTLSEAISKLKVGGLLIFDFKNIYTLPRQICLLAVRYNFSFLLPAALIERNFVNMRFGFHSQYVQDQLQHQPIKIADEYTKPPRLLEFENKSDTAGGLQGTIWHALDVVDRVRKQRAWCQLSYLKTDSQL